MSHECFYKDVLDSVSDGVYVVEGDRRITYWNEAAERLTGYPASQVVGTHCWDNVLMHVDETGAALCRTRCPLAATMADGQVREAEVFLHHREGHRVPVRIRVGPIRDEAGKVVGAVEVFSDSSWRTACQERMAQLEELAMLDPLTGVANRRHLEMSLHSRLEEMRRYDFSVGLLFSDIDHFKQVNDRYGHEVGDAVLKMVARTLSGSARRFDVLGRWGGEEFVSIVTQVDEEALRSLGRRCQALVAQSALPVGSEAVRVTLSIGGALAEPGDTPETLTRRADQLMYLSKARGRNRLSTTHDLLRGAFTSTPGGPLPSHC
jgi:diguanylate cyclase (GGDEF)-like protein/PAS domain S-box-containing protein